MADRYDVSGLTEAQYEPGSNEEVLRNLLGIKTTVEMDQAEAEALIITLDLLINEYDADHCFTLDDIYYMHKLWLGNIYEWAGQLRKVNISKGDFTFAMANRVPQLMEEFEKLLTEHTPCVGLDRQAVVKVLSEIHIEFELIHPFREGNGRVGRLLITLMALQAGLPLLNYDLFVKESKEEYFAAIQEGMGRNYLPMENLFTEIIENSFAD